MLINQGDRVADTGAAPDNHGGYLIGNTSGIGSQLGY